MSNINIVSPDQLDSTTELDSASGGRLLAVNASGKMVRVNNNDIRIPPVTNIPGQLATGPALHSKTPENVMPVPNGYIYVDDDRWDTDGSDAAVAQMRLGKTGQSLEYVIYNTPLTSGSEIILAALTASDALASNIIFGISQTSGNYYSYPSSTETYMADRKDSPYVLVVDRANDTVYLNYLDTSDNIQSVTIYTGVIPDSFLLATQLLDAELNEPAIFSTNASLLEDSALIPAGATGAKVVTGYAVPNDLSTGDIVKFTNDFIGLNEEVIYKNDLAVLEETGGDLFFTPLVVRAGTRKPLVTAIDVSVPTDYATLPEALVASTRWYVTDQSPSVASFNINIEEGHTLTWADSVYSSFGDYAHVRIISSLDTPTYVDLTGADSVAFIGLELTTLKEISGRFELSVPDVSGDVRFFGNHDGYIDNVTLILRGFEHGSTVSYNPITVIEGPGMQANSLIFDEEISDAVDASVRMPTIEVHGGFSEVFVRDGIDIAAGESTGDIIGTLTPQVHIVPYDNTDTVYVKVSDAFKTPAMVNIRHFCGKVDFELNGTSNPVDVFMGHMSNPFGNHTETSGTETPFEFTRFSTNRGFGTIKYSASGASPWPSTGYDHLIELNCSNSTDGPLRIEGFNLPDEADYTKVFNVPAYSNYTSDVVIDIDDLTALSEGKLFGESVDDMSDQKRFTINTRYHNDMGGFFINGYTRPMRTVSSVTSVDLSVFDIGRLVQLDDCGSVRFTAGMQSSYFRKSFLGMTYRVLVTTSDVTIYSLLNQTLNRINFTGDMVTDGIYEITVAPDDTIDLLKIN